MRILICDDEKIICEYLDNLIKEYALTFHKDIETAIFYSGDEVLFLNDAKLPYDLLFLDIEMQGISGLELAKKIRENDMNVPIVFITGISDYVFEGYEVGAYRYLLKPIKKEKLFEIIDHFYVKRYVEKYTIINTHDETIKLLNQDIYYVEAMGHYLNLYTNKTSYTIKMSIKDFYNQLNDECFLVSHRSYIVNLKHIKAIKKDLVILENKKEIPLARSYYRSFNEAFIKFYKEDL